MKLNPLFLIGVLIIAIGGYWKWNHDVQKARMDQAAIQALQTENIPPVKLPDIWGNIMVYDYSVDDDKIVVKVTSMGRDGQLGTDDDWIIEKADYNKSRLFGHYIGQRGKELLKGAVDGALDKSKFEEIE
jgi:hypothetical protein